MIQRIGNVELQALTAAHLDDVYADLAARGLAPRTRRYVHAILHKVLHDAERKRLVAHNIAAFATPPSSESSRAPEMKVWTPGQLRTFLDRTAEHHHGALFRLAALAGMRRGELVGLRWDDVDLDAGRLVVRHTITSVKSKLVYGTPKTGRSRAHD